MVTIESERMKKKKNTKRRV